MNSAELDAEIARLQDIKRRLENPELRENRRVRREQLLGRWAATLVLGESHLQGVRQLARDEAWLFEPDLMQEDGWKLDADKEQWTLPPESRSG